MSVWDKIKGALVEDESRVDSLTADPPEPGPDPNYVAPPEMVYTAPSGHHYATQQPAAPQPQPALRREVPRPETPSRRARRERALPT